MADTSIGKPVPLGVVDVEHDFVGIPENGINEHRELARLRRQVASLRARIEGGRDAADGTGDGSGGYVTPLLVTAVGLVSLVLTTALRARRQTETPIGRSRAVFRQAWRHFR